MNNEYSRLPGVDALLTEDQIQQLTEEFPHDLLVNLIRGELETARRTIASGHECPTSKQLAQSVAVRLDQLAQPGPIPVINATGVVLHTNLGRAPLSAETIVAMDNAAVNYSNLEFNLNTGRRGSRHAHIEPL